MFETNRIPSDWVDRCNKMDEVVHPERSRYVRQHLLREV